MDKSKFSPYRWIVLLSAVPALAMTNVFWLTFAPITSVAVKFYGVSPFSIAFLSMSFMIVYIIASFPASWLVDNKGFRISIAVGAVITAAFGLMRGIFAADFALVTVAQLGVAIGQPFLANAITKLAARWFPINERATATGIAAMAQYLGMVAALVLTPILYEQFGMQPMLLTYGYAAVVCAVIFVALSRERPRAPVSADSTEELSSLNWKNVAGLMKNKNFINLMICVFVVLGIFNAVMTWIEDILKPRGIDPTQAGLIGGLLVVVGIIGAVVIPTFSDKFRKRQPYLMWPILIALAGFVLFTLSWNYALLLVAAGIMGFFIMGAGPVAFQFGAEIAYPVPEGTSYGILMVMGQISGIIFIYLMDILRSKSGSMDGSMFFLIILMLGAFVISGRLKESSLIQKET